MSPTPASFLKVAVLAIGLVATADAGKCTSSHPFAYRPGWNFDYCCQEPVDNAMNYFGPYDSNRPDNCYGHRYQQCSDPPCRDFFDYENVALGKSSQLSTQYHPNHPPSKGTDGIVPISGGTNMVHTLLEPNPWYQIDLGTTHNIRYVRFFNRKQGCGSRTWHAGDTCLGDAFGYYNSGDMVSANVAPTVIASNEPCSGDSCSAGFPVECGKIQYAETGDNNPAQMYQVSCGVNRRYVALMLPGNRMMNIVEMEVLGYEITGAPTSSPTEAPTSSPTKAPTSSPTEAPTSSPTPGDIVYKMNNDAGAASLGYVFGHTGTNAYMCSPQFCLKNSAGNRGEWTLIASDSAEVLDAVNEDTSVIMTDGTWEVTPGGPTFIGNDGVSFYHPVECNCP